MNPHHRMAQASLFDLDHTLFKGNSTHHFGLFLYRHGYLERSTIAYLVGSYFQCKLGFLSLAKLHKRTFQAFPRSLNLSLVKELIESWLEEQWDELISPEIVSLLNEAKSKGHYTAILSNSPDLVIAPIAKRFGVDDWIATRYAFDKEGQLSHIQKLVDGEDKANYIRVLRADKGLENQHITAYSDSYLDLPFLQEAGNPIGVNPDRKLRNFCLKNGWKILIE